MRLCRICPSFAEKEEGNGLEIHLYKLTQAQRKLGMDITIVTAGKKTETKNFGGIKIHRIKEKNIFQFTSGPELLKVADKLAATENFDVIQVHNPLAPPILPERISKLPLVFSIHSSLIDYKNLFSFSTIHKSLRGYLEFHFIAKGWCDRAERITTGSSDEKNELVKFLGVNPDKIFPVLGKANVEYFRPGIKSNLKKELGLRGPVVLSVGRLIKKKGYEYLVRAFRRVVDEVPDANLVLVGGNKGDEDYATVTNLVKELNLEERFRLVPAVTKKDLLYYYSICDLYAQPSISEGFPQTVQDAMSCGKPVITTAAYGPKDIIVNDCNGFLVPKRNSEILAKRIVEILTNKKKMEKFGKINRKITVKKLTWETSAKQHYEICKQAIALKVQSSS